MTSLTRAELGALGEQLGADYLRERGLVVLERNWRCRFGELDVVAADISARTVVFVEVKTRTSAEWSAPERDIDIEKIQTLRRAARDYIRRANADESRVRFDAISITGRRIEHLREAFAPA